MEHYYELPMNIFVTDPSPTISAQVLPDKHVVKMPLESCQMLSIIFSHWYHNWGDDLLKKKDGVPYKTSKGAFRNHPCTQWAAASMPNLAWLIEHGIALSNEYTHRYGKIHSCAAPLHESREIFNARSKTDVSCYPLVKSFTRAMPDEYKHNTRIDTFTAYKTYIASKPWVASNYLRDPSRKPTWL